MQSRHTNMVDRQSLPEYVRRIAKDDNFSFACHPQVRCFTDCCRMLELSLTPYDALRLRRGTGLSSSELLEKYIIIEQDPGEAFPRCYLTMVDDGKASCVFLERNGCSVYEHRPGACRMYPLGRAVSRTQTDAEEHFIIMQESHCQGFLETAAHTPQSYCVDQQLIRYNQFNDLVVNILQHETIRNGFIPSHQNIEFYLLVLYNLDTFRSLLFENGLDVRITAEQLKTLQDDENLLRFGITLLHERIFAQFSRTLIK